MYQHRTEGAKESCSKKGEVGRLRMVMRDAVKAPVRELSIDQLHDNKQPATCGR